MGIAKTIISATLATGIIFSATTVVPLITAERVEAYSKSSCTISYRQNLGSYTWSRYTICYVDYDWWEESWLGGSHRDGWYYWVSPRYT